MARILVVDDDAAVRSFVSRALEQHGHAVTQAADGDTALAHLAADPDIGLLVTDIVMPGMDGLDLARAALSRRADLRILLMTGYMASVVTPDVAAVPGDDVVTKPFSLATICEKVDVVLNGAAARF